MAPRPRFFVANIFQPGDVDKTEKSSELEDALNLLDPSISVIRLCDKFQRM
jgi:hypothetical protein